MHSYRFTSSQQEEEVFPLYTRDQIVASIISFILSIAAIALAAHFFRTYAGSFTLSGAAKFNLHPFSMIIAIVLLLTISVNVWKLEPHHYVAKSVHSILNSAAVAFLAFGLWVIFTYKTGDHVVSMHSWFGLATAFLIGIQFLFGFCTFLLPFISINIRNRALPIHSFLGITSYALVSAT
jgi:cytochrome b-561